MPKPPSAILALDVGQKRIGVALATATARLPRPLMVLPNDESFVGRLQACSAEYSADTLVIGLPRGLDGQETAQTRYVREFAEGLKDQLRLAVHLQDEAATSIKAEEELRTRKAGYTKEDIDALSATYILEDFLLAEGKDFAN